nr:uncharacterized protein LOC117835101 [Setaria viridis]
MAMLGPAWRVFEVSFCEGLVVARALSRRSRWACLFFHLALRPCCTACLNALFACAEPCLLACLNASSPHFVACLLAVLACFLTWLNFFSFHIYGAMAESCFGFDLNVRLEDDDDGNLPLDLNEHEGDDGNAGFDLNEPEDDEHGNGFDLNLPLDEFGVVDFDYVQNLAGILGVQSMESK